jgi:XTP/dITP diphosphohydrolase
MKPLVFATNNQNKVLEIRNAVGTKFTIIPLKEAGIDIEIPEPHHTLEANATEKSSTIYQLTGSNCFSEDTGLEVEALNGQPGVKSARYAGDACNFEENIAKLLNNMAGVTNRNARFRTVISLIIDGVETQFEGICNGHITTERKGNFGFGYDAVFVPTAASLTFAQMTMEEKNIYSHRKKAMAKLITFLTQNQP